MTEAPAYIAAIDPILIIKGTILILAVAVGAASLWMGYSLFCKGILKPASASGEGHGVKVSLVDVGPGVFFAIFGAVIVTAAVYFPLKRERESTITRTVPAAVSPQDRPQVTAAANRRATRARPHTQSDPVKTTAAKAPRETPPAGEPKESPDRREPDPTWGYTTQPKAEIPTTETVTETTSEILWGYQPTDRRYEPA